MADDVPSPGEELSSIDFSKMIGGPLIAVVNAQTQAALATVNFVKQVGFKPKKDSIPGTGPQQANEQFTGEPTTVTFKYEKEGKETDLKVPLLTILPVPYIRVEETDINFLAKINSVEHHEVDNDVKVDAGLEAKVGCAWASANLKVSTAYQHKDVSGSNISRDYSLEVKVKAVQDEIPGGMSRVLSILENQIKETPAIPPTKLSTKLGLTGTLDGKKGDLKQVNVTLTANDTNLTPLTTKTINYSDGTIKNSVTTDQQGKATINYTLDKPGTLTVEYEGDTQYEDSKSTLPITVTS